MSTSFTITKNLQAGGKTVAERQTIAAGQGILRVESVPAAKAGTLSTRTDNTTGTLTLGASHGVTTGARIDLYWTGGKRRGVTVGTVSGTSVPISGGTGDNLPSQASTIQAAVAQEYAMGCDGDTVVVIFAGSEARGTIVIADGSGVELHHINLAMDGQAYDWNENNGVTNPLAGDTVAKVFFTHNSTAAAKTMQILVGTD